MSAKSKISIMCMVLASLLSACRSSKNVASSPAQPSAESSVVETSPTVRNARSLTSQTNMTAKVRVKLKYDGKSIGTSGMLRMRMGEVIQLSLLDPFLGVTEVGRMEIDPSSVLVIDRYNKQYVTMTYDELNAYAHQQLDYQTIEYHFWEQALRTDTDELQFQIPAGRKTVELRLSLSGKNEKSDWEAHTVPSNKYDRVSVEELFKSISDF